MGKNKGWIKRKICNSKTGVLKYQEYLIKQNYSFLQTRIHKNVLTCRGKLKPGGCQNIYDIKIECTVGNEPKTTIVSPIIEPSKHIHMYNDHSLCLHYPPDMEWTVRTAIFQYTIPWIIEWIIYYEIYLQNGNIWEGPESPVHFTEADKNLNVDLD